MVHEQPADSTLQEDIYPGDGFAYVAVLPDATIVCDQELAVVPPAAHVLEFAAGRPMVVFGQHSGSGWLAFAEFDANGALIRSHDAEADDQYELADSVAREMFGFTAESAPDEVVVHGFRVTRPGQAERDAAFAAVVAEMVAGGPTRMRMTPDGSLVPHED
ncbi:hypothetical protein GCM10022267_76050 [Lentzea roselyniae]|uniref:Uncharacterized protein n=1 Tax=Lentzea roselyniae TaxID=531940 RepID=A0ABP7C7F3_9PSEU